MSPRTSAIIVAAAGLAAASSPATAQNNIWIGAGAGLWIEFDFPLNFFFDDIHFTALGVSQHFHNQTIEDITDWVDDNIGVQIELHLEANAGIEIPGVGSANVGKAGAWVNGAPPIGRRGGPPALVDINGDGYLDMPLWEIPGDVDAMIVTSYLYDTAMVDFYMVTPAPRIAEGDPHPAIFIPMPPNPDYTFTPIATIPVSLFNSLPVPVPGEEFYMIPMGALGPGSPELREIAAITLVPGAGGCNPADLAEPFGSLDFSDVVAFLVAFGAMAPEADLAPPIGVFDFSDVVSFLTAFGSGCP
ncbi:MAG: GC-type dockerin domain-anchored protein [Phycisphaerales bacterium]